MESNKIKEMSWNWMGENENIFFILGIRNCFVTVHWCNAYSELISTFLWIFRYWSGQNEIKRVWHAKSIWNCDPLFKFIVSWLNTSMKLSMCQCFWSLINLTRRWCIITSVFRAASLINWHKSSMEICFTWGIGVE